MTLTLDEARAIADRAFQHAEERGLRVSVAVVDGRGETVATLRADGANWFTAEIARTKARTAAAFGRSTHSLAEFAGRLPEVFAMVGRQVTFEPTTVGGGIPVRRDGVVVGAIGISGATSEQDLACAEDARDAVSHDG